MSFVVSNHYLLRPHIPHIPYFLLTLNLEDMSQDLVMSVGKSRQEAKASFQT